MGKYDIALKRLQTERLERASQTDTGEEHPYDEGYNDGYIDGLEQAEEILFKLQNTAKANGQKLWYTGSPNDLKPKNVGTYIVIMRSNFNDNEDENPIHVGDIKIDTDFWDGDRWGNHNYDTTGWDLLYFTKLKWLMFPIPNELNIKRSDKLFFN